MMVDSIVEKNTTPLSEYTQKETWYLRRSDILTEFHALTNYCIPKYLLTDVDQIRI